MSTNQTLMNYLRIILGNDVEGDIVSYINSMKHEEDLEEFMENIVVKQNSAHITSYNAIRDIIFGKRKESPTTSNWKNQKPTSVQAHKKEKKKFRDINTYQEKRKEKVGRSACDCMGQEHEFMNNCLFCGRIHCIEEGPGPCLFCGNMITVRGDELYDADSRKPKTNMKHKENKVFDDDKDYFKINSKSKNTDKDGKKKMVVALDFATRRVIESTQEDAKIRERLLKESVEHLKKVNKLYQNIQQQSTKVPKKLTTNVNDDLVNLLIQMRHKKPAGEEDLGIEDSKMPVIDYGTRVFDEDLMANTDHGLCLSMHQPYASLLVAGVKKHEGRTWPTTHRGRLWIAAAAKQPEEDEVLVLESFYRDYYQDPTIKFPIFLDPTIKFPKEYPTSCLLGCVFIEDCFQQDEYCKKFPNGESSSPYVLICTNPIILPIFYPIVGKHKIYPLDKDLHICAKLALPHANYAI